MPAALFLILAATLLRVLPPLLHVHHDWISNFSPLASIILCGAVYFSKRMAAWAPLLILLVSDLVLNHFAYAWPFFSWEILPRYVAFAVIGAIAFLNRQTLRDKSAVLMGGSVAASLFFYIGTNTASWVGDVGYAKSFSGWVQALTVGLPGYPSTLLFLRNSLASDLLFTGLFIASMAVTRKKSADTPNFEAATARPASVTIN
jgi:hypothetical protein